MQRNQDNEDAYNSVVEAIHEINKAMQGKQYCPYSGCLVRYFEHYHIDQHTLTFLSPEELEKLNKK